VRTRTNLAIDALLITAYVLAANPAVTGISIHEWLGLGFGLIGAVHLLRHREWAVRTARGLFGRIAARSKINLIADALLLVTGGGVVITGLVISHTLLPLLGLAGVTGGAWSAVHALSAYGLVATVLLHVVLHWRWIVTAFRLHVLAPLDAAFEGARSPGLTASMVAWGVPVLLVFVAVCLALSGISSTVSGGASLYASATTAAYNSSSAASASGSTSSATLTCPRTGCTASTCHATQGSGRP